MTKPSKVLALDVAADAIVEIFLVDENVKVTPSILVATTIRTIDEATS